MKLPAASSRVSKRNCAEVHIPVAPQAGFPLRYNKLQGILAKANKISRNDIIVPKDYSIRLHNESAPTLDYRDFSPL